jgi:hypothetical protein
MVATNLGTETGGLYAEICIKTLKYMERAAYRGGRVYLNSLVYDFLWKCGGSQRCKVPSV